MKIATAIATSEEIGPLIKRVYGFVEAQMKVIGAGVTQPSDWDPLTEFIDPVYRVPDQRSRQQRVPGD